VTTRLIVTAAACAAIVTGFALFVARAVTAA
jgi:hypothetical protein